MSRYSVYGISLESDFDFGWPVRRGSAAPELRFSCVDDPPLDVQWDAYPAVHEVEVDGVGNQPGITYHRLPELDVVRIRGASDHYIWRDRIVCHLHDPSLAFLVEIQLLGLVLAVWLERSGVAALHASAVVVGDAAVAFLGVKGGGKTTAVAGMVAAGAALLADDLLAINPRGDQVIAQPGYPMLRLWPDQADHFVGDHHDLPLVHRSYTKRRSVVGEGFGSFHDEAAPLRRVYLPVRNDRIGDVMFEPLRGRDALIAVLQEGFLRDAVHGLGLAAARLPLLAAVVDRVPVRRVRYPPGFDRLPELAAAIEADIASG